MGSDVHLIVVGGSPGLVGQARARVEDLERRWSRFLDDSEVSRLNRSAGSAVRVSDETRLLVARALDAWRLSGGTFDPTVLGAVIRAGYDRSFEQLAPLVGAGRSVLHLGADGIVVSPSDQTILLPAGTGFDPGGIGKGLAADVITGEAMAAGASGVCVNLGGDVRVRGRGPEGGAWTVAVEHEWLTGPLVRVGLSAGAVATSSTLRRAWRGEGGERRHHLIDPGTGLPSDSDLNHVTVIAAEAWAAEVLAKAVLLRGGAHPFDLLGGTGAEALAFDEEGALQCTAGFARYLGDQTLPRRLVRP